MKMTPQEIEKLKKVPMVFILGKGRSGTSLLQNMLDANPHIIGGPESKFMVVFYPCFKHIKKWQEADILNFIEKIYWEPLFSTLWGVDRKELTEALLSAKEYATYELLCKIVYYQLRKGKTELIYISDKNPEYILFIDTIEKIVPDARFVHIVREPRDNIYSQITSFKRKNTKFNAYQWVGFNKIVERRKKKEPGKFLTVLYEELVMHPSETMKKVCEHLHITFDTGMTENKKPEWLDTHLTKEGVEDRSTTIHRNLLKPIDTSNVGKWKNKMTPYDQALTEIITGDFAHKTYGYEINSNSADKAVKIPALEVMKGKYQYKFWEMFTIWKMKSFKVNNLYSKFKRRNNKKVAKWEYF